MMSKENSARLEDLLKKIQDGYPQAEEENKDPGLPGEKRITYDVLDESNFVKCFLDGYLIKTNFRLPKNVSLIGIKNDDWAAKRIQVQSILIDIKQGALRQQIEISGYFEVVNFVLP